MSDKTVVLGGRETNLMSLLRWILREFETLDGITQFDTPEKLRAALVPQASNILILDAEILKGPIFDFLNELHETRPSLKTILIVVPTAKDEVIEVVKASLVKGVLVRPFTGEVVCRYVEKLL